MEPIRLITDLKKWSALIELACDYDLDGHSHLEVVERVKAGEFLAVEIDERAVLIIEVLEREHRVLNVVLCAGWAMPKWISSAVAFLRKMAVDQGCEKVRVQGRPGWVKVLGRRGFANKAAVMEMSANG